MSNLAALVQFVFSLCDTYVSACQLRALRGKCWRKGVLAIKLDKAVAALWLRRFADVVLPR